MRDFVDWMSSLRFTNQIIVPTYVAPSTGESTSLFDHTCTTLDANCKSYVLVSNLLDHHAIALVYDAHAIER